MREELLNIKDRLASVEENNNALWKASKQMEKARDEIQNNVDNIVLVPINTILTVLKILIKFIDLHI